MKVTITSGYNYSKHSLLLIDKLKSDKIDVSGVIIVRALSFKRFFYYLRQLDTHEFIKKFKDRILSVFFKLKLSDEINIVNRYFKENSIKIESIKKYCKKNSIPYIFVENLNSQKSIDFAKKYDIVVYSGGGIIGKRFLNKMKRGVINCHSGKLPDIKGLNSSEWSVLLNIEQQNSVHFMEAKIVSGSILYTKKHDYSHCKHIDSLRGYSILYAIEDIVYALNILSKDSYTLIDQNKFIGKQYYSMHPILKSIVNEKLK